MPVEALKYIPLEDRDAFKYALAATMVKNNAHWKAFETVFEVYFSLRGREYHIVDDGDGDGAVDEMIRELLGSGQGEGGGAEGLTPEQLAELLYRALMDGNDAMMRAVARCRGHPLRRHGTRPAGGRDLLPVPHPPAARPRRRPGADDGGRPPADPG